MKNKDRLITGLGFFNLVGGISAVLLILVLSQTGWGPPGSNTYKTYELLNRLMGGVLLLISAGWLGLVLAWPSGYAGNIQEPPRKFASAVLRC